MKIFRCLQYILNFFPTPGQLRAPSFTPHTTYYFLEDTSVGRWLSAGGERAPRVEEVGEGGVPEGKEGGPGPP